MLTSKNFSDIVAFTRASAAWRFSSGGVLVQESANVPRLDYDPVTLAARGLLVGEQRTNAIRNNSMVGAAAGGPGTLPTNWGISLLSGVNRDVVGSGTESGIPYVDIRFYGTATAGGAIQIRPENSAMAVTAGNSQSWSASYFLRLVGGSLDNVLSVSSVQYAFDSGLVSLGTLINKNITASVTSGALVAFRDTATAVTPAASTAYIQSVLVIGASSGAVLDFTLRIGAPQLEQGAFASSPILTTNAQVTRATDSAIITDLSKIGFNPSEGTVVIAGECYNANAVQQGGSSPRMMVLYSSSNSSENMSMYRSSAGNQASATISTGGAGYPVTGPVIPSGSKFKMAFAYKSGDNAICVNGAAVNALGQVTLPSGIDRMSLGSYGGASGLWSGWLTLVNYIPQRVSNSKLQSLTAP